MGGHLSNHGGYPDGLQTVRRQHRGLDVIEHVFPRGRVSEFEGELAGALFDAQNVQFELLELVTRNVNCVGASDHNRFVDILLDLPRNLEPLLLQKPVLDGDGGDLFFFGLDLDADCVDRLWWQRFADEVVHQS